jgi:hypothetical protein
MSSWSGITNSRLPESYGLHVGYDGGLHEVAGGAGRNAASADQPPAFGQIVLDVADDPLLVGLADLGTHVVISSKRSPPNTWAAAAAAIPRAGS